jgi:hypothetical protein
MQIRILVIAVLLASPLAATAVPIGSGDFGAGAQVTTFDGLGLPFDNLAPLFIDGHTITTDTGTFRYFDFVDACVANECIGTDSELGFIDVVLSDVFQRVGAWGSSAGTDWQISASFFNAADELLGSVMLGGSGRDPQFAGWHDAYGIARIRFDDLTTNGFIEVFDNLTVERVPEPGTLALLGIGLMGLGLARRAQKGNLK